jgi:hypothetical protein
MKKSFFTSTHDYENDTTVEYVDTGLYSMLNCSFTSEDPDYGTETIHYVSKTSKPEDQLAYEMRKELKKYLDFKESYNGHDLIEPDIRELRCKYGDFINTTLYAVEGALQELAVGYVPEVRNADGNLIQIVTVEEAAKIIAKAYAKKQNVRFDFGVSIGTAIEDHPIEDYASDNADVSWYGVKRIMNDERLFDDWGLPTDYIFMVGHYGGGNIAMAYFVSDDSIDISEWDGTELADAICESADTKSDEKIVLEMVELKEEE